MCNQDVNIEPNSYDLRLPTSRLALSVAAYRTGVLVNR